LVKARGRIRHALACDNDVALEPLGHALPCLSAVFKLLTLRERRIRLCDQSELEVRDFTEDSLGLGGVLDTGKLYNDTVSSLPLNQRLRNTQLIHAISKRGEVLSDGVFHSLCDCDLGHLSEQLRAILINAIEQ